MTPITIDQITFDRLHELFRLVIAGRLTAAVRLARELRYELSGP